MDAAIGTVRFIHIAAGFIALVVAPGAMLTLKGGWAHRRWGKTYFWSMAVVALTALPLGLARPNVFLVLVALFSFYLAFSGYRALFLPRVPAEGRRATSLDWGAALVTVAASLALIVLGVLKPGPVWQRVGMVPLVFGALGVVLAGRHLWSFARPPADQHAWWFEHMIGMLASYIATVSAFSVVNFTFLPTTTRWLWPTVVGTPLIALWVTYYKRRFARVPRTPAAPLATTARIPPG